MALRFQDKHDEVDRAAKESRGTGATIFLLLVLAVMTGAVDWFSGTSLASYEKELALCIVVAFFTWLAAPFYYELRIRTKEIDGKASALLEILNGIADQLGAKPTSMHEYPAEQTAWKRTESLDGKEVSGLLETLNRIADRLDSKEASMHEYLAEQTAWKTTERLDGRVDGDLEPEHNSESHDLVVKGIKCLEIARDYHLGGSVPRNKELAEVWYRRAVPWYELAAGKSDCYAQEKLGDFYSGGIGVQRDDAKALNWWRLSAHAGRASAQYRLGETYFFGKNGTQNFAEAVFWFDILITSHPAGFVQMKREAASYRDNAAQRLTPAELKHAQERARKWFEDHPSKAQ